MGTDLNLLSPAGPELRPEWSMRLVIDVVLGVSTDSILECHDLASHQFDHICKNPVFVSACENMRKSLEKEGATFRLKAQLQADHYLQRVHEMIMDPDMDPRVTAKLIGDVVRWGGLDTPPQVAGGGMGTFSININFPEKPRHGVTIEGNSP